MSLIVYIESLLLLLAAWHVWRRARPAEPPYGKPIGALLLALILQVGLLLSAIIVLEWLVADPERVTERTTLAALATMAIQVARTLLLFWAVLCWLQIAKPRLKRSWRGVTILVCLAGITFLPVASTFFSLCMLIPLLRLKWTGEIHGWRRFGLIFFMAFMSVLLFANVQTTLSNGQVVGETTGLSGDRSITLLEGDLSNPAEAIIQATRPWGHAVRVLITLLHLQILVAFFKLLVLPIRLRGLSLKRRFTVTLAMYRLIPGVLALFFMILIIFLGIGMHRTSVARLSFDNTLDLGLRSAETLLVAAAEPSTIHQINTRGTLPSMDLWMDDYSGRFFFVIRDMFLQGAPEDSTSETHRWAASTKAASPRTPDPLLEGSFFGDALTDSAMGMVESDGRLYLRSARAERIGDRATLAEVFVEIDSLYLSRIAQKIQADVRIDVSPGISIGPGTVNMGESGGGWSDSTFSVLAPFVKDEKGTGFWERKYYLSNSLIPVGNWLIPFGENIRVGAVQLKLSSSPRTLFKSLTGNVLMLTSNAFAIIIFILIGMLFGLIEISAVRTGRSIIRGIVKDVKQLSEAAKRFGQGDLSFRVEMSGKDEIGQLASTFNRMAENIEQHQEVLLEKERLEADLALARDIQQRMLPQSPPVVPGLDMAGVSIPSREVGGDLFYFLPLSSGRLGITIGDVSGKSVPAALLMSNVLAALKAEARLVDEEDQILRHLNHLIIDQVEPGRFVTFFYGVVDPKARTLRYVCAGHNPPLLVRRPGDTLWLDQAGVPLGILPESAYIPAEVELRLGDVLVLYSDGVTEAQRSAAQGAENEMTKSRRTTLQSEKDDEAGSMEYEFFDEHRLEATVKEAREKSASEVIHRVVGAVRDFTNGADLSDDLTLVVLKLVGP